MGDSSIGHQGSQSSPFLKPASPVTLSLHDLLRSTGALNTKLDGIPLNRYAKALKSHSILLDEVACFQRNGQLDLDMLKEILQTKPMSQKRPATDSSGPSAKRTTNTTGDPDTGNRTEDEEEDMDTTKMTGPLPWPTTRQKSTAIIVDRPSNVADYIAHLQSGLEYQLRYRAHPTQLEQHTYSLDDYDAVKTKLGSGFYTYTPRTRRPFKQELRYIPTEIGLDTIVTVQLSTN